MITRITKFQVKSALSSEFESFVRQFRDELISVEGCRHFDILKDKENDNQLFMIMIWKEDDFLDRFRQSDLNKLLVNKLNFFSEKAPSSWTVETVFDPNEINPQNSFF